MATSVVDEEVFDGWLVVGVRADLGVDKTGLKLLVKTIDERFAAPPVVVTPRHSNEEGVTFTDLFGRDMGLRVSTDIVQETRPDGDWSVSDLA